MAWTIYYLMQYPEVERKLRAEIESVLAGRAPCVQDLRKLPYLLQVIQESLRLRPPAWVDGRISTRDVELGGFSVRRDTMLLTVQFITHRDPRLWKDPEVFRPERFAADSPEAPQNRKSEMPFFPFGAGNFNCIGMNYAVNEASLMVILLLQHFRLSISDAQSFASIAVDARLTMRPDRPVRARIQLLS